MNPKQGSAKSIMQSPIFTYGEFVSSISFNIFYFILFRNF